MATTLTAARATARLKAPAGFRPFQGELAAMHPRLMPALPVLPALIGLALAACAHSPATTPSAAGTPAAVALPPPTPMTVCVDCGRISAMVPGDIPRWRFTVQMDNGTEALVFQEKTPALAVGAFVRLVGGRLEPR
jgi:hypothetical protein